MRTELYIWNEKTYLIFITEGAIKISDDGKSLITEDKNKFRWSYKCIDTATIFHYSKETYQSQDYAIIAAITYIYSNN